MYPSGGATGTRFVPVVLPARTDTLMSDEAAALAREFTGETKPGTIPRKARICVHSDIGTATSDLRILGVSGAPQPPSRQGAPQARISALRARHPAACAQRVCTLQVPWGRTEPTRHPNSLRGAASFNRYSAAYLTHCFSTKSVSLGCPHPRAGDHSLAATGRIVLEVAVVMLDLQSVADGRSGDDDVGHRHSQSRVAAANREPPRRLPGVRVHREEGDLPT